MICNMYCIYDLKTKVYHHPELAINDGDAKRKFQKLFNQNNMFSEFPEDFRIFHIGIYDDATAKIETDKTPILLTEGKDLFKKRDPLCQQKNSLK